MLLTSIAAADCDFKTGEHIDDLKDPSKIRLIEIMVQKNAKFAKNFLKIAVTPTDNIPPHLRKWFDAKISVRYDFGICKYKGRVKQNGDGKDHIQFLKGGQIVRSLNVKLFKGNILNAVRFKILIPATRNNLEEVFAISLMKALDIIAPETVKLRVNINGVITNMLFQEDAQKELLERNSRREGPILEGDETLLWRDGRIENDSISLSRLSNDNWFLKGDNSAYISLHAYKRLQLAYLSWAEHIDLVENFLQPNKIFVDKFYEYHFLMLALNAEHGLIPHNRRFYFNSFLDDFEPIYYDGNVELKSRNIPEFSQKIINLSFSQFDVARYVKQFEGDKIYSRTRESFMKRADLFESENAASFTNLWNHFIRNVKSLQEKIALTKSFLNEEALQERSFNKLMSRAKDKKIYQDYIESIIKTKDGFYKAFFSNGTDSQLSPNELVDVMSKMRFQDKRTILVDPRIETSFGSLMEKQFSFGSLITSEGIKLEIDEVSKEMVITQTNPEDWVLFLRSKLEGWTIKFKGLEHISYQPKQRFNKFGITGCLSFYETEFIASSIFVEFGGCEDSLNIIKSYGQLREVRVLNAMADAIDLDFSNLKFDEILAEHAGNDCFDVSGGQYKINKLVGIRCFDKAISAGERSSLWVGKVFVNKADFGIATKDLSYVEIVEANFADVKFCYVATQKKQEFGGGFLSINDLNCKGKKLVNDNSYINLEK